MLILNQEPEKVGEILGAIQTISDEAKRALSDPELSRDSLLSGLSGLIDENHAHLVALGVSHPSLEEIRQITAAKPHGLHTKLTGAGGGGCAVTLIPDGRLSILMSRPVKLRLNAPDYQDSSLSALQSALRDAGYAPYTTSVGGSGLGVLPSNAAHNGDTASKWQAFTEKPANEFASWIEGQGRWLYV